MRRELICPRCYQPLRRCDGKHEPLPLKFTEKCREAPPLSVVQAGFANHGKTVFLSALTMMLEELGTQVPGFSFDYLGDQITQNAIKAMRSRAKAEKVAPSTKPRPIVPLFMQVRGVDWSTSQRKPARTLILYDTAGEFFSDLETIPQNVPVLAQADVVWFVVSPLEQQRAGDNLTLGDLFQSYRSAIESSRQEMRGRKIIVVLTMADRIVHEISRDFGDEVHNYLADDPFSELTYASQRPTGQFSLPDYIRQAEKISGVLREYVRRSVPGGRNFVQLAENHGVDVIFCITSALGHEPNNESGRFAQKAIRYRVLDPFFWTLWIAGEHAEVLERVSLRLVLDAARDSAGVFEQDLPGAIWDALSRHSDPTTHYLGQTRPAFMVGQRPAAAPPSRRRLRLVGPLLDSLADDALALVVTSGEIGDLAEYKSTTWKNRLLVAVTREPLQDMWPQTWLLRPGDDYEKLARALLALNGRN